MYEVKRSIPVNSDYQVIVVGGGPAGVMAAIQAAKAGHEVTLIEQNEKLGKKLFITGTSFFLWQENV